MPPKMEVVETEMVQTMALILFFHQYHQHFYNHLQRRLRQNPRLLQHLLPPRHCSSQLVAKGSGRDRSPPPNKKPRRR